MVVIHNPTNTITSAGPGERCEKCGRLYLDGGPDCNLMFCFGYN